MNSPSTETQSSRRNRLGKYLISLDLGSDSTVAYVKLPEEHYKQVDLQYFAGAFATRPKLLTRSGRKGESPRLRSRYAINEAFQWDRRLTAAEEPEFKLKEWLPNEHATQPLVDFEGYSMEKSSESKQDLSHFGRSSHCLIKFFEDETVPFPSGALLPNAKLVFQSNVGAQRRCYVTVDEERMPFHLDSAELIKNQVCLILENFVRNNPALRTPTGEPPAWSDCTVVLTVPNTYSPIHSDLLRKMVKRALGCEVYTLTESDAVVFYYLVRRKPNIGLSDEELLEWRHQYLTIDIGKGTTDLSLMDASFMRPNGHWKQVYGIRPDDNRPRLHVYVAARTGRASGGAKVTFLLAQFLETLVDLKINEKMPSVAKSPFRLTTKSRGDILADSTQARAIQAFESVCEALKKGFSTEGIEKLTDPTEATIVAKYLSQQVRHTVQDLAIEPVRKSIGELEDAIKPYSRERHELAQEQERRSAQAAEGGVAVMDETSRASAQRIEELDRIILASRQKVEPLRKRLEQLATEVSQNFTALEADLTAILSDPESSKPAEPEKGKEQDSSYAAPWAVLCKGIADYVRENVDDLLMDLERAHFSGNDIPPARNAAEALRRLVKQESSRFEADDESRSVRTHVIIAGQGSQFKPLRARLETLCREVGLGEIQSLSHTEEETPVKAAPQKKGLLNFLTGDRSSGKGKRDRPTQNLVCELDNENLKDGCAYGALDWLRNEPIMMNPDYIHGQLVFSLDTGGQPIWVDMDALNAVQPGECFEVEVSIPGNYSVYYLPARGEQKEHPSRMNLEDMGSARADRSFHICVRPADNPGTQIEIRTESDSIKWKDNLFGAHRVEHLRPLLWPAVLMD